MNPDNPPQAPPLGVGQTFLSAGEGDFPVASPAHRPGKAGLPADRNVCPTRKPHAAVATLLLLLLAVPNLRAGTLTGVVRAEGKPGTGPEAGGGKYDSRKFKFVERVNYAELRDFVVYIDGPVGTNVAAPPHLAQVVTQRVKQEGARFSPHILPVAVGTTVEWPNSDDILHNVFSFSDTKSFDLGLYKSPEVKRVTFDHTGRVDVFCSIHSQMSCIILVLPNPYFTKTDDQGQYIIRNVPAGTYKLKAWHERLPSQLKDITVPETGELKVDFTLGIKNLPTP
jgi:plastocyanin